MPPRAQNLRLVDPQTGEVLDESCPNCAGAEKELRAWRVRYANLKREVDGELAGHAMFPRAKRLHDYWRDRCRHPNVTFTTEDFKQSLPRLKEHDDATVRNAIDGAAYDCFTTIRKNGSVKRFDDWELIMRKGKFEEFANRAPYHLPNPDHIKRLAEALAWVWGWEPDRAVHEAKERLK